jgi:OOP family OmpA-OmpF porin
MRAFSLLCIAVLLPAALGCAAMDKPWGKGALIGAITTATAAGTAAGVAANQDAFGDADPETRGAAIGIGIVGGAAVGALVGHLFFDKEAEPGPVAAVAPPPAPAPPPIQVLRGAHFAFDSAALTPAAETDLTTTLETLEAEPALRVRIDGHTDSVGSDTYNLGLSERRAASVKAYLVARGIAPDRIAVRGLGSSDPVASNATPAGRAQNRRVEIHRAP